MALKVLINNGYFSKLQSFNTLKLVKRLYLKTCVQQIKVLSSTKPRSNEEYRFFSLQEELLSTAIKKNRMFTVCDWDSLKKSILEKGRNIDTVNFDAKTIAFCIHHRNFEAAESYINYLYSKNEKPNIATLGKFLRIHYICNEYSDSLSKIDEAKIINIYEDLQKSCPIFDSITAENVIHALSLTKQWKKCLEILETIKIACKPSGSTYSAIARAAFINKDYDIAMKVLDEMILNGRLPYPTVYHAWLKTAITMKDDVIGEIEKLLNFFAINDIHPSKDVTDELLRILKPFSYTGFYTNDVSKRCCSSCNNFLQQVSVDKDDFEKLRSVFFENVIVGKNIFYKTTPEELNRFKDFVAESGPYDMVIDGLNVAYSAGNKQPSQIYAKMVSSVVNHFAQKSKKILVLGRIHMNKWPREQINYIRAKADLFLAQNLSQDDPYILYATMASGLGTGFLSRDFMRGHAYLLMDQNLKRLFRRWQQLHQHSLVYVENNGKVHIKYPYKSLPTVQTHQTGWHIPYVHEFMVNTPLSLDPPKNWLCLQKIK